MNHRRSLDCLLLTLLVAGTFMASGCGKGEYERRVLANTGAMRLADALGPAIKIPGTDLMIQLPKLIDNTAKAYNETSPEPNGNGVVNPGRLNPPFFKIPGLRVCYEKQFVDTRTNSEYPMFWYLGVLGPQDPRPDNKSIDQYAKDKLPADFPPPNSKVEADTVTIGGQAWNRVTATGDQQFIGVAGNVRNAGGTFQLLVGEVNNMQVVVAFRVPAMFLDSTKAVDIAALVAGSIKLDAPAPAAPAQAAPGQAAPPAGAAPAQ